MSKHMPMSDFTSDQSKAMPPELAEALRFADLMVYGAGGCAVPAIVRGWTVTAMGRSAALIENPLFGRVNFYGVDDVTGRLILLSTY